MQLHEGTWTVTCLIRNILIFNSFNMLVSGAGQALTGLPGSLHQPWPEHSHRGRDRGRGGVHRGVWPGECQQVYSSIGVNKGLDWKIEWVFTQCSGVVSHCRQDSVQVSCASDWTHCPWRSNTPKLCKFWCLMLSSVWLVKCDHVTWILASHWFLVSFDSHFLAWLAVTPYSYG